MHSDTAGSSRAGALRGIAFLLATLLALLLTSNLSAQPGSLPSTSGGSTSGSSRGDRKQYGDGVLLIDINIWGHVRSPGKYSVPISARLLDVISLAGGPAEHADMSEVKVVHDKNTVDSSVVDMVRVIDVEAYQNTGDPAANPVLNANDTIIIPGDTINSMNQVISIVSNVAVVTLSIIGLIVAFKSKQ